MSLCEAYNYQLLDRWEKNRDAIIELFEEFKQANCYETTLEAVEDSTVEDPEDLAVAIVNKAMTYAAQVLYDVIQDEVWVYVFHCGSPVIAASSEFTF